MSLSFRRVRGAIFPPRRTDGKARLSRSLESIAENPRLKPSSTSERRWSNVSLSHAACGRFEHDRPRGGHARLSCPRQARQWKGCPVRGGPLSLRPPFRNCDECCSPSACRQERPLSPVRGGCHDILGGNFGGPSRNRTGVYGFAVRCVTTPPSGLRRLKCVETAPLAVSFGTGNPLVSLFRIPIVRNPRPMRAWRSGAGGLCAPQRAARLYYHCNTASLRLELPRKGLNPGNRNKADGDEV